jgi:hypothetical protein
MGAGRGFSSLEEKGERNARNSRFTSVPQSAVIPA